MLVDLEKKTRLSREIKELQSQYEEIQTDLQTRVAEEDAVREQIAELENLKVCL